MAVRLEVAGKSEAEARCPAGWGRCSVFGWWEGSCFQTGSLSTRLAFSFYVKPFKILIILDLQDLKNIFSRDLFLFLVLALLGI